jgi:hypothetical protein
MLRVVLLLTLSVSLTACTTLQQDRRDAPWDPKRGQTLFDQIPNEDGGANRVCCGHLRSCKAHQTPKC